MPHDVPTVPCRLPLRTDPRAALWRPRSRLVAGLLGVTLGAFGVHRWYLGYSRMAVVQLLATLATAGVAGVWGWFEGGLILAGVFGRDARGHRLTGQYAWQGVAATSSSLALHVGAVWMLQHSSIALLPPPHGVNAIELTATLEAAPEGAFPTLEPSPAPPPPTEGARSGPLELPEASAATGGRPARLAARAGTVRQRSAPPPARDRLPAADAATQTARPASPARQRPAPRTEPRREAARRPPRRPPPGSVTAPSVARRASRQDRGVQSEALPRRILFPRPIYPPELQARGITGRVTLRVRVGADGRVEAASVYRRSGHRAFDQAALDVIWKWQFQPARRAGIAVATEVAVPIRFVIESDDPPPRRDPPPAP